MKRFCLVRHRYYPGDPRMENQVLAALDGGFHVTVVCMRRLGEPFHSKLDRVDIYRLPALERKRTGQLRYALEYMTFCATVFFFLAGLHLWRRQNIIHVQNLPDFLVFVALVPKLLGAKVIIDFRECTPELYSSDHQLGDEPSRLVKTLIWIEQLSLRFADMGLTCTDTMREKLSRRGTPGEKIAVMLDLPDRVRFATQPLPDPDREPQPCFHLVTHGTVKERYGHEVLLRAMALVKEQLPGIKLTVAGSGPLLPYLEQLSAELGLEQQVKFTGFLPDDQLLHCLKTADCGVIPLLRRPETDIILTNKMYEFIALGVPVIISRTTAVMHYFTEQCFRYVEADDSHMLAHAIYELHGNRAMQHDLACNALEVLDDLSDAYGNQKFTQLLNQLVGATTPIG